MSDLISRQAAIDAVDSETVSTNSEHFKSSEKFIKFMNDDDIASFGKWQWANGYTAVVAAKIQLKNLPTAQPEIVRCGECVYRRRCTIQHFVESNAMERWYCADGVRDINVPSKSDEMRKECMSTGKENNTNDIRLYT